MVTRKSKSGTSLFPFDSVGEGGVTHSHTHFDIDREGFSFLKNITAVEEEDEGRWWQRLFRVVEAVCGLH